MNGNCKWHKATSPAFNEGEVWVGNGGRAKVRVVGVRKYPGAAADDNHTSSYGVTYEWEEQGETRQHEKDCWNFQVRYSHIADLNIDKKYL